MSEFAPCPKCGSTNAKKVGFTFWGGIIGPRMLSHVKCQQCWTAYNGKTGKSNTVGILIYIAVIYGIVLGLCILLGIINAFSK
jgi:hypothetical protein